MTTFVEVAELQQTLCSIDRVLYIMTKCRGKEGDIVNVSTAIHAMIDDADKQQVTRAMQLWQLFLLGAARN